jgi:hypothetical protein
MPVLPGPVMEQFALSGLHPSQQGRLLVCCNIQFLTIVTGHCLVVGVRLAVPFWFGRTIKMKRVRQAVPLQPGRSLLAATKTRFSVSSVPFKP